jgi:pantoate--beta-alanine ligase
MQEKIHYTSLAAAADFLYELKKGNQTLGTIHTLGALHDGHGALIKQSSIENDHTIVTIYPNKIQLIPGSRYIYNLEEDVEFAFQNGATAVISSTDEEMFPQGYKTFIDQGEAQTKLAGSVLPKDTIKGMITGCIRWINFTQPDKCYFGLKDIEQSVLVKRAVSDLLIKCDIVLVPCVRFRNGVPISSRLMSVPEDILQDVSELYKILNAARISIFNGETNSENVIDQITSELKKNLKHFTVLTVVIADGNDFQNILKITLPFVIRVGITYENVKHFDGLLISTEDELANGCKVIWLD